MSLRLYLMNTDFHVADLDRLQEPAGRGRVMEIAEAAYNVPLPWLACFRAADLVPCRVTLTDVDTDEEDVAEMLSPCAPIETALINLIRAQPFFERLTGEKTLAHAYWKHAIDGLKRHKLPYLAVHATELLNVSEPEELDAAWRESLAWTDAGFAALKSHFLAWTDGVPPIAPGDIDASRLPRTDARLMNALSLDAHLVSPEDALER